MLRRRRAIAAGRSATWTGMAGSMSLPRRSRTPLKSGSIAAPPRGTGWTSRWKEPRAAVLPGARNRRDRVFADEVRIAGRQDDAGAGGGATGGRFPPPRPVLPGTAVDTESGAGRIDEANRRAPRALGGRSRDRVDAAASGGDGRHRRHAQRGAGGWGGGGAGIT